MAVLLSFLSTTQPRAGYDASTVRQAKHAIVRAIAAIQEQSQLTHTMRDLAVCELTLEQCAVYAVAAREFIEDLHTEFDRLAGPVES